jgi:hypothetical protein
VSKKHDGKAKKSSLNGTITIRCKQDQIYYLMKQYNSKHVTNNTQAQCYKMHQVSRKSLLFITTPLQNLVVTQKLFYFIKVCTTSIKIYARAEAHTSMNNTLLKILKTWWDSTQLPGTRLIVPPRQIIHQVHLSRTRGLMMGIVSMGTTQIRVC